MNKSENYIRRIVLDSESVLLRNIDLVRQMDRAIHDIEKENKFQLKLFHGPYALKISIIEKQLRFDLTNFDSSDIHTLCISFQKYRNIIKDYNLICENYIQALAHSNLSKIEAIDMGRRSLHNEGATLIIEDLSNHITCDLETARKLFTILVILYLKQ